jgi:hypothetical protein
MNLSEKLEKKLNNWYSVAMTEFCLRLKVRYCVFLYAFFPVEKTTGSVIVWMTVRKAAVSISASTG